MLESRFIYRILAATAALVAAGFGLLGTLAYDGARTTLGRQIDAEMRRLEAERDAVTRDAEAQRKSLMQRLADFEANVSSLLRDVSGATEAAGGLSSRMAAEMAAARSKGDAVALAIDGTDRNVQTVAAATEQLSASIGGSTDEQVQRFVGQVRNS